MTKEPGRPPAGGRVEAAAGTSPADGGQQAGIRAIAGVILANDQDRRTYTWLCDQVGEVAIAAAVSQLCGRRRPYLSNIARVLGVALPRQLAFADPSTAAAHIRALRDRLAARQSS